MKEIIVKNNLSGLRIFVNGVPDIKLISKDEVEIVVTALERQISESHVKVYSNSPNPKY